MLILFGFPLFVQEGFEHTKGIIRICKSKDRQHNDQKKKNQRTNIDQRMSRHVHFLFVEATPMLCSVMAELYQLLGRLSSITNDLCVVMYDVCENYYWDSSESTKTFILRLNYKLNDIQCIASYDFFKTRRVPDFRCTFKVNMYRREDKCWVFEEYEFRRGRFSYRIAYQKVKM